MLIYYHQIEEHAKEKMIIEDLVMYDTEKKDMTHFHFRESTYTESRSIKKFKFKDIHFEEFVATTDIIEISESKYQEIIETFKSKIF